MFSRTFAIILAAASLVAATPYDAMAPSNMNTLLRRDVGQINVACSPPPVSSPSGSGLAWSCVCPYDLNGDTGVLINFFPGYQCAYPNGACTWDDKSGALQNTRQTNCPTVAPCPSTGCVCPPDNNTDTGVLINQFKGYQCAYPHGACTWDNTGALTNTRQTNCPTQAKCVAPTQS